MPDSRRRFSVLAACALLLGSSGCIITDNYPLGNLSVQVLENNVGVPGVLLDLYKLQGGGATYWRATATGTNGIGTFGERDGGVVEGDYFVRVSFLTRHQLAQGETNDRPVTVSEGDNITLTFNVEAIPAGGP